MNPILKQLYNDTYKQAFVKVAKEVMPVDPMPAQTPDSPMIHPRLKAAINFWLTKNPVNEQGRPNSTEDAAAAILGSPDADPSMVQHWKDREAMIDRHAAQAAADGTPLAPWMAGDAGAQDALAVHQGRLRDAADGIKFLGGKFKQGLKDEATSLNRAISAAADGSSLPPDLANNPHAQELYAQSLEQVLKARAEAEAHRAKEKAIADQERRQQLMQSLGITGLGGVIGAGIGGLTADKNKGQAALTTGLTTAAGTGLGEYANSQYGDMLAKHTGMNPNAVRAILDTLGAGAGYTVGRSIV